MYAVSFDQFCFCVEPKETLALRMETEQSKQALLVLCFEAFSIDGST